MKLNIFKISANFFAVLLLVGLVAAPIYFAHNFAKVSGVKTQSKYLLVSQIDKFPNLTLTQNGQTYKITYSAYGPSQAFLGFLVLNNPTNQSQTYILNTQPTSAKLFFGNDQNDQKTKINIPPQSSVEISMQISGEQNQTAEFNITSD